MTAIIDATTLSKMFLTGAKSLESKKEWINELNVFPVPDGDTGTNMTMTILSAVKEVNSLEEITMQTLAKAISSGSLRGARGNSGVILSQLFRGFTKVISEKEVLDIQTSAIALEKAVETAYKAVMKPKEGTILTVARAVKDKAVELQDTPDLSFETFMGEIIQAGDEMLKKTPEMLPVLKQAGVVDSGGQGLMEVLRGMYDALLGNEPDYMNFTSETESFVKGSNKEFLEDSSEIKYGYCTEFIIMTTKTFNIQNELDFKSFLESIGDSIVVVADDEIVKVHVHTNDPGLAIQNALKYGALSNLKIDNMRLEHEERLFKQNEIQAAEATSAQGPIERKAFGFIAVSVGKGIHDIFKGLGVDYLIEGGQTMNPSTDDMLNAIEKVNADHIFILPNNSNIILAANQAAQLCTDKNIYVVPTKTVPQGITSVINFIPDLSAQENLELMTEEMKKVKTGQVTYAVRDTVIEDKEIRQGDYMGIGDKGILSVGTEKTEVTLKLAEEMISEDHELISIYYGSDIALEEAEKLKEMLEEKYSDSDIELQYGGQPIYYYIISAE